MAASKVLTLFDALLSGHMPALDPERLRALLEQYIRDSLAEFEEDYRARPARSIEEASFTVGPFAVFPSVVSKRSWNVVFRPDMAVGKDALLGQDRLVIDGRLNLPKP